MARAAHQSMQRYPLTAILGTDAGVRLVRELALHGGQLAAPDLVRRTGLAKASVARGLDTLEGAGIVRAAGSGRSVLHSLRPEHPLCPALSAVFEAEQGRFQAMLAGIRDAARTAAPGLVALWLFGMVARGVDRTGCDLVLALVLQDAEHRGDDDAPRRRDEPGGQPGGGPGAAGLAKTGSARFSVADAFRDGVAALAERAGFTPSVVVLSTGDVVRLSAERDPWWREVVRDAIARTGERPEALAARSGRAATGLSGDGQEEDGKGC